MPATECWIGQLSDGRVLTHEDVLPKDAPASPGRWKAAWCCKRRGGVLLCGAPKDLAGITGRVACPCRRMLGILRAV